MQTTTNSVRRGMSSRAQPGLGPLGAQRKPSCGKNAQHVTPRGSRERIREWKPFTADRLVRSAPLATESLCTGLNELLGLYLEETQRRSLCFPLTTAKRCAERTGDALRRYVINYTLRGSTKRAPSLALGEHISFPLGNSSISLGKFHKNNIIL